MVNMRISNKGQKSLELIIGLLILLVVAAVVINIFLSYVSPEKLPKNPEDILETRRAKTVCDDLCKSYQETGDKIKAIEYCTKKFPAVDWNEDKTIGETKINIWDVCEDAVYCFHLVPCEWTAGKLGMKECKKILCDAYMDKYENNETLATQAVWNDIKPGSCDLPPPPDNWWLAYFNSTCG